MKVIILIYYKRFSTNSKFSQYNFGAFCVQKRKTKIKGTTHTSIRANENILYKSHFITINHKARYKF